MRGMFWLAQRLLVYREGLCATQSFLILLLGYYITINRIHGLRNGVAYGLQHHIDVHLCAGVFFFRSQCVPGLTRDSLQCCKWHVRSWPQATYRNIFTLTLIAWSYIRRPTHMPQVINHYTCYKMVKTVPFVHKLTSQESWVCSAVCTENETPAHRWQQGTCNSV